MESVAYRICKTEKLFKNRFSVLRNLQETHPSLAERATHLYKCNDMANRLKHAPPHMCYHAECGRSALKDVGINTGNSPKLLSPRTPLSWDGRRGCPQDPRTYITCVTTSNLTKSVRKNRNESQNLVSAVTPSIWWWGHGWPPKTKPLPISVTAWNLVVLCTDKRNPNIAERWDPRLLAMDAWLTP